MYTYTRSEVEVRDVDTEVVIYLLRCTSIGYIQRVP